MSIGQWSVDVFTAVNVNEMTMLHDVHCAADAGPDRTGPDRTKLLLLLLLLERAVFCPVRIHRIAFLAS